MKRIEMTDILREKGFITTCKILIVCLYLFIFLISSVRLSAQYIDNKSNIYFSLGTGSAFGKKEFDTRLGGDVYKTPGLFAHYEKVTSWSIDYVYQIKSVLGLGGHIGKTSFSSWQDADGKKYSSSTVKNTQVGLTTQIQTPWRSSGFFNLVTFRLGMTPSLNYIVAKFPTKDYSESFLNSDSENTTVVRTLGKDKSRRYSPGLSYFAGMNVLLHDRVGIAFKYTHNVIFVKSDYYPDERLMYNQFSLGLFYRLHKDKRFMYK